MHDSNMRCQPQERLSMEEIETSVLSSQSFCNSKTVIKIYFKKKNTYEGLSWWLSGKESVCQCRRHGFNPRSGKIPHVTEHQSSRSCAPEPGNFKEWVHVWQLMKPKHPKVHPCSTMRAAIAMRSLHAAAREKPEQQQRPSTAKK